MKEINKVSPEFLKACDYLMKVHGTKPNSSPLQELKNKALIFKKL